MRCICGQEVDVPHSSCESLRCDGSRGCPAQRHIFGCFRSTLADDVECHPNWTDASCPQCTCVPYYPPGHPDHVCTCDADPQATTDGGQS